MSQSQKELHATRIVEFSTDAWCHLQKKIVAQQIHVSATHRTYSSNHLCRTSEAAILADLKSSSKHPSEQPLMTLTPIQTT